MATHLSSIGLNMTIFDSSSSPLLQGVSQQIPSSRVPGQLSSQLNMVSDPVSGLRRRPGAQLRMSLSGNTTAGLKSWYMEMSGIRYDAIIEPATGVLTLVNADTSAVAYTSASTPYLQADEPSSLRVTFMSGICWILNVEKTPIQSTYDTTLIDPNTTGFYYVKAGAFSKTFSVTLKATLAGVTYSGTYTYATPSGTTTGDADKADPTYIYDQLKTAIMASTSPNWGTLGLTTSLASSGCLRFLLPGATLFQVTSGTGTAYVQPSNSMKVSLVSDLPATMPAVAVGMVCAVGSLVGSMQYYKWSGSSWVECGCYHSYLQVTNMPMRLYEEETLGLTLDAPTFIGRYSGDDENNPYPECFSLISGMSTYQGRLMLLSGDTGCLSASDDPLNFMRTTCSELLDNDPIGISSGNISSAYFEHAIQFNRDLILYASTHQAVIPASSVAITPKNAMIVLTGTASVNTKAAPTQVGHWLLHAVPNTPGYSGVAALVPSAYSASQYQQNDLTAHLPTYFPGTVDLIAAAGSTGIALLHTPAEPASVFVHQQLWQGDQLSQVAFHKWTFPYAVLSMHFRQDTAVLLLDDPDAGYLLCTLEYKQSEYTAPVGGAYYPMLDLWSVLTITGGVTTLPVVYRTTSNKVALPTCIQNYGAMRGEQLHTTYASGSLVLDTGVSVNTVIVGYAYTSEFTPNPPILKDGKGNAINLAYSTLVRYVPSFQNTAEFTVQVTSGGVAWDAIAMNAFTWASPELVPGSRRVAKLAHVTIPVNAPCSDVECSFSTSGTYDMNLIDLEFTARVAQPRLRK